MMWAATVRRCPTGHSRHPSQFGARLQLARALTHAPYLICDGVYSCPPPTHSHFDSEVGVPPYRIPYGEPSLHEPSLCDHVVDCDGQASVGAPLYHHHHARRGGGYPSQASMPHNSTARHLQTDHFPPPAPPPDTPYRTRIPHEEDEVRVELPYSRRELEAEEDYPLGERIIRRYDEIRGREEPEDDGVVGLSYQQRSIGGGNPYGGEVWGTEPSIDCWGDRPLLLKRGRTRELVRTLFVVGLSFTLVTFVVMGFEVYNMLITTLFLFFLLSTVSLLIFLLMRKPTCFSCCREPFDVSANVEDDAEVQQQGLSTYLTESQGVVLKKRLSDSPPPYESPPDYHSLPPEVLVSARGLSGLESSASSADGLLARVHGSGGLDHLSAHPQPPRAPSTNSSNSSSRRSRLMNFASRSSSSLLASAAAPLLSSSSPSSSKPPPPPHPALSHPPSPPSPPLCSSGRLLVGLTSCRPPTQEANTALPPPPPPPPPPPYECVVIRTEAGSAKEEQLKPC